MKKILAWSAALVFAASPAGADSFADYVTRLPHLPSPYLAADLVPVVRNGIPYSATFPVTVSVPSVLSYGAKCDGTTNDSAAFQLGIDANAFGALVLPSASCVVNNLVISKPIHIMGQGAAQSFLISPNGSTHAVFIISVDDDAGSFPAQVELSGFNIRSPDRTDPPGIGVAHGIKLLDATVPVRTRVLLANITIFGVAGDGVHAGAGEFVPGSWVESYGVNIIYPGAYGIFANSTTDWRWFGGEIAGAIQDNVIFAGTSSMIVTGTNIFVAVKKGVHLFNADRTEIIGATLDTSGEDSLYIDNQGGQTTKITNTRIRWSSTKTNATYSDLLITGGNTGDIFLSNVDFPTPASSPNANKPLRNITFTGGNTGTLYASNVSFALGNWQTSGVMNTQTNYAGVEPPRAWTPTLIGSTGGSGTLNIAVGSFAVANKWVSATAMVQSTSLAGLTGNLRIGGLPHFSGGTTNDQGVCVVMPTIGWTAPDPKWTYLTGLVAEAAAEVQLWRNANDGTSSAQADVGEFAAATKVQISCQYHY